MSWLIVIFGLFFCIYGFVVFLGSPYIPSHLSNVKKAFDDLYDINEKDLLVDFGSGDGLILREAARRGARAVGFEINPFLVCLSRLLSFKNKKIIIKYTNIWTSKLPDDTTIVYVFSVSRDMKKIKKLIQNESNRLNKIIYIINYGANLDDLKPIKISDAHQLYMIEPLQSY